MVTHSSLSTIPTPESDRAGFDADEHSYFVVNHSFAQKLERQNTIQKAALVSVLSHEPLNPSVRKIVQDAIDNCIQLSLNEIVDGNDFDGSHYRYKQLEIACVEAFKCGMAAERSPDKPTEKESIKSIVDSLIRNGVIPT